MIINMDSTNYTNNSFYINYNLHHSKGTIPKIVVTHWLPIYGLIMSQSRPYAPTGAMRIDDDECLSQDSEVSERPVASATKN